AAGGATQAARNGHRGTDARLREEALRAGRTSAAALFVGFAIALFTNLAVLEASPCRALWFALTLACWSAYALTPAPPVRWRSLRGPWRSGALLEALAVASLRVLALAPWLPGPLAPPPQRVLLVLALLAAALTGVPALASLRVPLAVAAALPLSA